MLENRSSGVIINVQSISKAGNMAQSNCTSAKSAVTAMAVTWAKELASHGIRAVAIAPDFLATDILNEMKPKALKKYRNQYHRSEPQEIANAAVFVGENDSPSGRTEAIDARLRL